MTNYNISNFMAITRALADENRVRVLLALEKGELCVCQIVELLDLAPSTVSKHMAILKQARLVRARKEGRWVYYRLPDEASPMVGDALGMVCRCLEGTPEIQADCCRLDKIVNIAPEELCEIQKARP